MQQVGIIAEQVVDQPGGMGMAGQRAQQVIRGVLPSALSAMPVNASVSARSSSAAGMTSERARSRASFSAWWNSRYTGASPP